MTRTVSVHGLLANVDPGFCLRCERAGSIHHSKKRILRTYGSHGVSCYVNDSVAKRESVARVDTYKNNSVTSVSVICPILIW